MTAIDDAGGPVVGDLYDVADLPWPELMAGDQTALAAAVRDLPKPAAERVSAFNNYI